MTLRGQINKISHDYKNATRRTAMKGVMDAQGGIYGTRKISGYVCNVHAIDDENDELAGTVDVQEYNYYADEDKYEGTGWHEGVKISALQNNNAGYYIMPTKFSDVIIVQDPVTLEEYVLMCSHVDVVQIQSHQSIKVGVVETEEFKESDDDSNPDVHELPETGNAATTEYTKDHTINMVKDKDENAASTEHTKERIVQIVKTKDGNVTITQTATGLKIEAKDTTISVDASNGKVSIDTKDMTIQSSSSLKTSSPNTTIDGSKVQVTGSQFIRKGTAAADGSGGFCAIPVCPFSGAPHIGTTITGG